MILLLSLLACNRGSAVPEGGTTYQVTVTAKTDECHPESTTPYQEEFSYYIFLDASNASVYIGEQLFAVGLASGCTLTYQTPIIGEESDADGKIKWQLFGEAEVDAGDDACVPGENDWEGSESFEVVASDDDTLEVGCEYITEVKGKLVASP